jgi:hypothetical protein
MSVIAPVPQVRRATTRAMSNEPRSLHAEHGASQQSPRVQPMQFQTWEAYLSVSTGVYCWDCHCRSLGWLTAYPIVMALTKIISIDLSKRQRNELFEITIDAHLTSSKLRLEYIEQKPEMFVEVNGNTKFRVIYQLLTVVYSMENNVESRFWIRHNSQDRNMLDFQGRVGLDPGARWQSTNQWPVLLDAVSRWAKEVAYYESTPDYWVQVKDQQDLLSKEGYQSFRNTTFSDEEQAQIARNLRAIADFIQGSGDVTDENMTVIRERLDDIESASKHLGRKDWLLLFMGGVVSLVVGDILPPSLMQHVFSLLIHSAGHLFGLGGSSPKPLDGD